MANSCEARSDACAACNTHQIRDERRLLGPAWGGGSGRARRRVAIVHVLPLAHALHGAARGGGGGGVGEAEEVALDLCRAREEEPRRSSYTGTVLPRWWLSIGDGRACTSTAGCAANALLSA